MRYYQLEILDPSGQMIQVETNGLGFTHSAVNMGPTFSSTYTPWQTQNRTQVGQPNPNALNIEFDFPVAPLHTPEGGGTIRVWGLGIRALSQAWNLNPVKNEFKTFTLRAGMSKGLPLANPAQRGIVAQGKIFQAWGNWHGTEQTLDMIVIPGGDDSIPLVFDWRRGQNLQSALAQMFSQAMPSYRIKFNISQNLVAPSDQGGCYRNYTAFAQWLHTYTKHLGAQTYGSDYDGVSLFENGNTMYAYDGAGPTSTKTVKLNFQDLVGQPTWLAANTLVFQTVLRSDINIGDHVTFPTGVLPPFALTTPNAAAPNAPAMSRSIFSGTFVVTGDMHYFANFRQADAESWNTTYSVSTIGLPKRNLVDTPPLGPGMYG